MTTRRAPTWARWLGWTLAYGVAFWGLLGILSHVRLPAELSSIAFVGLTVPSFLIAHWVGRRFPEAAWLAGPPAAILAPLAVAYAQLAVGGDPLRRNDAGFVLLAAVAFAPFVAAGELGAAVGLVRGTRAAAGRPEAARPGPRALLPPRDPRRWRSWLR